MVRVSDFLGVINFQLGVTVGDLILIVMTLGEYLGLVKLWVLVPVEMPMTPFDFVAEDSVLHVLIANVAIVPYHSVIINRIIMVPLADFPNLKIVESIPVILREGFDSM